MIIDPGDPLRESVNQLRTELWYVWAEVAEDHEAAAAAARRKAAKMVVQGKRPFRPLEDEVKASMVAVAASAHALDAYATAAREAGMVDAELIALWKAQGTSRAGQIHQTLVRTFDIGSLADTWYPEIKWLFALRDETVHYRATWADLERHPLGFDSSRVAVTYRLESSARAVDLLMIVIQETTTRPKPRPDVEKWCGTWKHAAPELQERRHPG